MEEITEKIGFLQKKSLLRNYKDRRIPNDISYLMLFISFLMDYIKVYIIKIFLIWLSKVSQVKRRKVGIILGWIALRFLKSRVHIVHKNLQICFPKLNKNMRKKWVREHFYSLGQSLADRGVLWYGSDESIRKMTKIAGIERIKDLISQKRSIILLTPHFLGIDAAGTRLSMELKSLACMYKAQKSPALDSILQSGRKRFNNVFLIQNKNGLRNMIKHLQVCRPVIYLPDMDFGKNGSVFAPFFGMPASTLLTTAQIARKYHSVVVPVLVSMETSTGKYQIKILPGLKNFPGSCSLEKATARLNSEIENWILDCPTQYYWVHRRFKTRPYGEQKIY